MVNDLTTQDELFNQLEKLMIDISGDLDGKYKMIDCPLEHTFTTGLYSRKIFMPAGSIILSEKHKTTHQYAILDGVVSVYTDENGWKILQAPFSGITKAGTQRLLKVEADCTWITFHPTDYQTIEEVHEHIIEKTFNPLINGRYENNVFVPDEKLIKQ